MLGSLITLLISASIIAILVYKEKEYKLKLDHTEALMFLLDCSINSEIPYVMDFVFDTPNSSVGDIHRSKHIVATPIGKSCGKGYDFWHITQTKSDGLDMKHVHKKSNELFFVLKGRLKITLYDKHGKDKIIDVPNGGCLYVKRKIYHSVAALEDSVYFIIAKPPLLTRIGKFYERLSPKR